MIKEKYRRAVFIVVYRKTKSFFGKKKIHYLMLKRRKHWIGWEFPKGGIDGREKFIEAAQREVFEECGQKGFNFQEYKFSGKYKYPTKLSDRPGVIGQTFKLFSTEVKDRKVKIDEREHSGYKWASFERAIKMLAWSNQKEGLKIVNDRLN